MKIGSKSMMKKKKSEINSLWQVNTGMVKVVDTKEEIEENMKEVEEVEEDEKVEVEGGRVEPTFGIRALKLGIGLKEGGLNQQSLPDIPKNMVDCLLNGVSEGLLYVTLVEESLNATDHDHVSIQKAAETLWVDVEVYHKWLGTKLPNPMSKMNTPGDILQWLRDKAKNKVNKVESMDIRSRSYGYKYMSICANSMYCITETILLNYHDNIEQVSQEELFAHVSSRIADIIAACLTNLPQVILMKCHEIVIEKREASVQVATQLLGETKQIIIRLRDHELPSLMNPYELAFIDKWCAYLENLFP
ncbi:unnamed protein product [Lactuca virosa]|uniref:Uncharacterized protein n=1 Tax=Lactuca virosa TaxID=75947 RepID=A0AAU9PQW7_9ASTR|nr:unnamed protein product [Lactuca virosa]